ncbi:MAG TPA: hypothetical protein VM716_12380 [Gemmatimonadales bacterium]|nr:hypothetical protein [Gemmatimonadales bacterium]
MVLALLVGWGCYIPAPAPAPQVPEETVAGRMQWIDPRDVPREFLRLPTAPYVGPYYILISVSGHYCVVSDDVYVTVQDEQRWACDWRPRRPG